MRMPISKVVRDEAIENQKQIKYLKKWKAIESTKC